MDKFNKCYLIYIGFYVPISGMLEWAQALGETFPLTHFIRIIRAVMLKGADFAAIEGEITALVLFVIFFVVLALLRFRRTLD